jgi:hypothetical protein
MRILRGLSSRLLPCGCVAGIYETYDGDVVTILDERATSCLDPRHADGNVLPEAWTSTASERPTETRGADR